MKSKIDYKGKNIFVGIDVHKKTYSVAVVCDGELVKRDSMTGTPEHLIGYLNKYFSNAIIKSAYEAGFSGFYLHRLLLENGIENIVVHPAAIEVSSRDRVKTDKRDATKIAIQLSTGRLNGIFIPSKEREEMRELTRLRDELVKQKNRIAVKMKHKAYYYGLISPEDTSRVSPIWIKQLLKRDLSEVLRYYLKALADQWHSIYTKIKEVDKLLAIQAREDEVIETIFRSVPGIGPTAARILANELGDMSQFSSEKGLFSYTGLTPCEYSSGEHRRQGHISRQGKPVLRKILVQCSWVAIRCDNSLREIYQRIAQKAGGKRAIVAVARRLVGRMRACIRKKQNYEVQVNRVERSVA